MPDLRKEELYRQIVDALPLMPELPELDVPDSLPSLQYVASDMYYQGDAGASIAPSVASLIPELPSLADPNASVTQDTPKLPLSLNASWWVVLMVGRWVRESVSS